MPARLIDERIDLQVGAPLQKADYLQRQNDNDRRDRCRAIQSRAAGHADRGDDPNAGGAGQPADAAAIVQDESRAQKADALHDVRGHLSLVGAVVACQHRGEERKERRAHADEQVGAHTGGLAIDLPLQADQRRPARRPAAGGRSRHSPPQSAAGCRS